jgi:glyoxylase-like metal-dependent hydrolase (beta-lactamase superfamily II)
MGVREPIAYQQVEGLRVGLYGQAINTACTLYRVGETLIDTGPGNVWRKIRPWLEEKPVKRLLLTHHHEDHAGNAGRIEAHFKPEAFSHPITADLVTKGFPLPFYRWLVWGKPARMKSAPKPYEGVIQSDDSFTFVPVPVPGHAEDLVAILEPNHGWLFTGDLFISGKPKYTRRVEDPNLEIESLRNILKYDFQTVFCAHRCVLENGRDHLAGKLNYMVTLREQVRHYTSIGDSVSEITKRLLGKEEMLRYFSFGEFAKRYFVEAFVKWSKQQRFEEQGFGNQIDELS